VQDALQHKSIATTFGVPAMSAPTMDDFDGAPRGAALCGIGVVAVVDQVDAGGHRSMTIVMAEQRSRRYPQPVGWHG
jgi:hypothetical protein